MRLAGRVSMMVMVVVAMMVVMTWVVLGVIVRHRVRYDML
jgi:hypothetical protein